jgi:hypothetical protein
MVVEKEVWNIAKQDLLTLKYYISFTGLKNKISTALLHNQTHLARIEPVNHLLHWPSYNQSLVRRGEILFSYDFLHRWDADLARMNENKNGKKYKFPDSFILINGYMRILSLTLQANRRNHKSNCRKESSRPSMLFTDL